MELLRGFFELLVMDNFRGPICAILVSVIIA